MTSNAPAETQPLQKHFSEFKLDQYADIPPHELVVFAVLILQGEGVTATMEEIVSNCFRLFPHRFSLANYFFWPDSALVARYLDEAKEYIKGNPADGVELKVKGKQVGRRVAKALGVSLPEPVKAEKKPAAAKKETKPKTAKPKTVKKTKAPKKKASTAAKEKEAPKKRPARKSASKKTKRTKKQETPKAAKPVKKTSPKKAKPEKAPAPKKKTPTKRKPKAKAPLPAPQKKTPTPKPKAKQKTKKAKAAQQLALPIQPSAKAEAQPKAVKPSKKRKKPAAPKTVRSKNVQPQKTAPTSAPPQATKEEKAKAGKFIKLMEKSDAYRQYRKAGAKARISEFDFRNMLFATMESSAETLTRNVQSFKRYAGIQNRDDLIDFLAFCETSFAPLLRSQAKHPAGKSKR